MDAPRTLPAGAVAYSRTKLFDRQTLPDKLGTEHSTKAGVWALIHVESGQVDYVLSGADTPLATIEAGQSFVVLPQEVHRVALSDDAAFFVEFHRMPGETGPDDPHR